MRVTSNDVARAAGVSQSTVSHALSPNPKQRVSPQAAAAVMKAVEELGYRPNAGARSLRLGRSDTVLMPLPPGVTSHATDTVVDLCGAALVRRGLTLVTERTTHADDAGRERAWSRLEPAAVIDIGLLRDDPVVAQLRRAGVAIVSPDLPDAARGLTGIDQLSDAARLLQVRHLLGRGCRSLVLAAPPDMVRLTMTTVRLRTIRRLVRAAGATLTLQPVELTRTGIGAAVADWSDVDGVAAHNDELAVGLLTAARQSGIAVPEDLALIGLDDDPLADIVGLTTVAFGLAQVAESMAETTLAMIDDGSTERRFQPPPLRVSVRQTT